MRFFFLFLFIGLTTIAFAQEERDTIYKRCPIFITDTITANNFFLENQPATVTVNRVRGNLNVTVRQKEQFFTIFFMDNKLKEGKYVIKINPGRKDVFAKYSFRSGDQVSYVNVSSGVVIVTYNDEKSLWELKLTGLIANLVGRSVTYYKAAAKLSFK